MSDWQPIETAPRDGTGILVCTVRDGRVHGYAVVRWQTYDENVYVSEASNIEGRGGWAMDDGHDLFDYGAYQIRGLRKGLMDPTHWQPLPDPPK